MSSAILDNPFIKAMNMVGGKVRRLGHLDQLLRALEYHKQYFVLPVDALDMTAYYGADDPDGDCSMGMAASADGCAALHPWFRDRGLTMYCPPGADFFEYVPQYRDKRGAEAVAEFFGITPEERRWIFDADSYDVEDAREIMIHMVSLRIRDVMGSYLGEMQRGKNQGARLGRVGERRHRSASGTFYTCGCLAVPGLLCVPLSRQ